MKRTADAAAQTREALIEAGLAVFSERGVSGAALEDIAKRAGVTRGALYHHFADKAELYGAAVKEQWQEVFKPLLAHLHRDGEPLKRIENFLSHYFATLENEPKVRRLLEVTMLRTEVVPELRRALKSKGQAFEAWADAIADVLEEGKKAKALRAGVSPRIGAAAVVAFANGVATTWVLSPAVLSPNRDSAALASLLVAGLRRPQAGRE